MKPLEKIKLIDDIGRELQSIMTFSEIDSYLEAYGISTDHSPSYNSKYVYVKEILPKIDAEIVIQIANELNINHDFKNKLPVIKETSISFWKTGHFRLFISHLSSFKKTVGILKGELEKYGISAFVAHDDIEPTKEWQEEIEKGLFSMDALCAILMPGFHESSWTDQEVGIAIGRGVLVIPIKRELDPYGFLGKFQGFQTKGKNIGQVAEGIFKILTNNPKTRNKMIDDLLNLFLLSNNQAEAVDRINALHKIEKFPKDKIDYLIDQVTSNLNLKNKKVINEVNAFISTYNYSQITMKSFEKVEENDFDDLPF